MTWQLADTPELASDSLPAPGLVLVLGPDPEPVGRVARQLGARSAGTHLVDAVAPLLVGWDLGTPDLGPPTLVTADRWLRAARALALGLVGAGSGERVVVAAPGPLWTLMYLRRVLPDATVVLVLSPGADPDWDAHLPQLQRPGDLVVTAPDDLGDLALQVAAACPVSARRRTRWTTEGRRAGSRLVVLLGSGRSGTTWLHAMLCASPSVAGTPMGETWVFRMLEPAWRIAGRSGRDRRVVRLLRAFANDVLLDALAPDGRALVCEKTPDHVHLVPLVRQLFPGARFVHLVRDGRDVAMSLHAVEGAFDSLRSAARSWAGSVAAAEEGLRGARASRSVRYEDLLADPVPQVERLWAWLGVDAGEQAVAELRRRVAEQVSPLPSTRTPGSGRWRELTEAQLAEVVAGCGPALSRWGYGDP